MILDGLVILILLFAVLRGRKAGLFRILARFLSLAVALAGITLFGEHIRLWISRTSVYKDSFARLVEAVENGIAKGEYGLLTPFMGRMDAGLAAETVAGRIGDSAISVLIFLLLFFAVRLLILVLDKTIFHLPLVRPVNKFLGMALSFVFTACVLYFVLAGLGSLGAYQNTEFLAKQMESSLIARYMYEHNFVLQWTWR